MMKINLPDLETIDILESISDCFYALDKELRFTYVNKGAQRIWGISQSDLIGRKIEDVFPGIIDISLSKFHKVLKEQTPQHFEVFSKEIKKWVYMNVYPSRDGISVYYRDNSEQKQAEESLRESEARYRNVVQNTSAVIMRLDPNGIIRFANQRALEFFGYKKDELIGKPALGTFVPERDTSGRDLAKMAAEIMADPDRFHTNANENMRRNGERVWMEWTNSGMYDGEGHLIEFMAVGIDVTERKRAEEALHESKVQLEKELEGAKLLQSISTELILEDDIQSLYLKIINAASKIMCSDFASIQMLLPDKNNNGKLQLLAYLGFNNRAAEFWKFVDLNSGSSCGEALRKGERIIMPDVDKCLFIQGTEDQEIYKHTGIRACQTTPLISRSGKLVGMISTHWRVPHMPTEERLRLFDVLVRQAADLLERKQADEALRDNEVRLRELSENLAAEIEDLRRYHQINMRYIQQEEIHFVYKEILDAAISLTNADCGNLQLAVEDGQTLDITVHTGLSNAFVQYFQRVSSDKTACARAMEDKARVIVEDVARSAIFDDINVLRVMLAEGIRSVQSTPMFSGSGNFMGMLSTHYKSQHQFNERELRVLDLLARQAADLLERQHADAVLRKSEMRALALVSELEKADENKNRFISVLSHELRNPLAAISTGVQLLEITQDQNHAAKVKDVISRQVNQLCKLVDDLLELTRITQNKIKLKKEYIRLDEIVRNAVDDMRLAYEKKGVILKTRIQSKPVLLNADPIRITQIIGNILMNALKFTQENGEVRVELKTEGNNAAICVKDNGIGISPEILPGLFTPFTQADNTLDRSRGGLGLGLSIVKGIVDLHEGSVSAFSEGLGKGAVFTIRLPLGTEDRSIMENQTISTSCGKCVKLLLIEDNKDFADLLSTMLSTMGYSCY